MNPNTLKVFSDEQLEAELKARAELRNKPPTPLPTIRWDQVSDYIKVGVYEVSLGRGEPKDFEHYLFELVMEAVYGREFWVWWNRNAT